MNTGIGSGAGPLRGLRVVVPMRGWCAALDRIGAVGPGRAAHLTFMTTATSIRRQPPGSPVGGQFAAAGRAESTVDLDDRSAVPYVSSDGAVTDVSRLRRLLDEQSEAEREAWRRVSFNDWNHADAASVQAANPHSMGMIASVLRDEHPEAENIKVTITDQGGVTNGYLARVWGKRGRVPLNHSAAAEIDDRMARVNWRDFLNRFTRHSASDVVTNQTAGDYIAETGELYISLDVLEDAATAHTGIEAPRLAAQRPEPVRSWRA